MADESKNNFEKLFTKTNKIEEKVEQDSKSKEDLFAQIRDSLRLDKNRPADKQAATRILDSFIESLQKNNSDLLIDLADSDKKLLEQTIDEISKLQNKTLEEFKKSLASINKLAEELSRRGENTGSATMKDLGEKLKESTLQERFKAEGLTLEGKDDTFKNRLKQELFGNSKEPGREGKPTRGLREGFKNFGSGFMAGFKESLAPKGGFIDRIATTQESRREDIRNEVNRANAYNSEVTNILEKVKEVIRGKKEEPKKKTDEEQNTDARASASNAPDIENTSKVVDGKVISENANESAQNIEGATKSVTEEQKAGITDADPSYSRSATQNSQKEEDRWDELIDLLKEIRDCVCECGCDDNNERIPTPSPTPVLPKVTTAEPTAIPQAESSGLATGAKVALGAAATGAVALLTRRPQLAARVGKLFSRFGRTAVAAKSAGKPLALPAPARMAANGERLALPAPSMGNRAGVTLEELGVKSATREKVLAGRPTPNTSAQKTIAQRFQDGELSAREAAAQQRVYNRNLPAEQRTKLPSTTESIAKTEKITNTRLNSNSNFLESSRRLTREEYIGRLKATESENQLLRNIKTDQAQANAPLARANASEAKLARTLRNSTPAAKPGLLSKVGGGLGKVGRVGGKLLGPLGAALDFGSRKAEGQSTTKAAIGTAGGLAGGIAGAEAGAAGGAAIGALFGGVGAVPGAVIGGIVGGIGGALFGGTVADKATDAVGMRASGGPVSPASTYIVGEKGPELFTPNTAGSITNNMNSRNLVETGQNNISNSIDQITNEARENTAPVINVPPPTVIPQPIPTGGGSNIASSLHADTVRTEDSSWQRFQNRRTFG